MLRRTARSRCSSIGDFSLVDFGGGVTDASGVREVDDAVVAGARRSFSIELSPGGTRIAIWRFALLLGAAVPLGAGLSGAASKTPVATFEPGEDRPGGAATSRGSTDTPNAFSLSSGNMDFKKELDFKIGNGIFRRSWVSAPASTDSADGLGPQFNARGCQNCHLKDGRGHTPRGEGAEQDFVSMLFRISVPASPEESHGLGYLPEPTYGLQLQDLAIQGQTAEGRMRVAYREEPVKLAGGETAHLRVPTYGIADPGFGPLDPRTMISPRIAPPMIGLGLLEAVPEAAIVALADPDDADRDGISGRPNRVAARKDERVVLGRFGWKAAVPTIEQQSAEAFAADIGLSTPMIANPAGECTEREAACLAAPNGESPRSGGREVGKELFDLVVFYSQNLAVPARRDPNKPQVLAGKALFGGLGCSACHHPSFVTGEAPNNTHLSHQTIWPYTDLLLHDMGEGLADNRPEGAANGREWRTPPLWGVGLTKIVSGHSELLHDGRARNVEEAILWHGGEAQKARDAFATLPKADRDRLFVFVNSL